MSVTGLAARHHPKPERGSVDMAQRLPEETPQAFVRRHWCVWTPDGAEDTARVTRVLDTLARQYPDLETRREIDCPDVPGVPRLRDRIDEVSQLPEVVRRYLPEVEADPRLLALSFVDPLRLATDHPGMAVSQWSRRRSTRAAWPGSSAQLARGLERLE
jgi:hypothetical protein